jgi:UDP-N-acetyl-D-glucosamine/UDP-N-acetyl-D-galactosamine dehydrogenase
MSHQRKISVIGLGYVGLPVALAFGKTQGVIGFDVNQTRVAELKQYHDRNQEFTVEELQASTIHYTAEPADLKQADFHIIAVPTPVTTANYPDLTILLNASKTVGSQLKKGDIVVYESTVYPGVTEEECIPVLEKYSKLKAGKDFTVGYSPERINPGDKTHTFTTITKVVSGQDKNTLDIVANVYSSVVSAGVFKAANIKTAEAAKVIENTQRDINIALMNELAMIFDRMNIDTQEVLTAAGTKWNFLPFRPGLVGGHCIGVDPYYLTYKATQLGYHPEVILAGRRINDSMGTFIATQTIKQMVRNNTPIKNAKIAILGLTFKENCPDLRNSRVIDILTELKSYGVDVLVHDPLADTHEAFEEYKVKLTSWENLENLDAIIIAVAHQLYQQTPIKDFLKKLKPDAHIIDVKTIFKKGDFANTSIQYWRL